MKNCWRSSVHEFLGDNVVYRNLVPFDTRLPPFTEICEQIGLSVDSIPRKSTPDYAHVMVYLLQKARALEAPGVDIERLIYVGDTRMNDGTAFANICQAGNWPGLAFIGSETDEPAKKEVVEREQGSLYLANRWSALADFEDYLRQQDCPLDEQTAIVIDLDKTALGARGRNDHVIDLARVEAVRHTVGNLLGDRFDPSAFQLAYDRLNQQEFHPFTADNQDYLAYICLILGSGMADLETLVKEVREGSIKSFDEFIRRVENRRAELPANLSNIHSEVYTLVQRGDPTPFKTFRYNEYQTTIHRMGWLDDSAPVEELLQEEIVITQEVRRLALEWRGHGALLFGLSDKPDEASVPTNDLAAQGYKAIHKMETHVVGG
jgi:hypothetical protein